MPPPAKLLCSICKEICKRASKIPCCGAQCCWGCGVRTITRNRKCWNCPNITVVTGDLVKDTRLRDEICKYGNENKEAGDADTKDQSGHIEVRGDVNYLADAHRKDVKKINTEKKTSTCSQLEQVIEAVSDIVPNENELADITFGTVENTENDATIIVNTDTSENASIKYVFPKSSTSSQVQQVENNSSFHSLNPDNLFSSENVTDDCGTGALVKGRIPIKEIGEVGCLIEEDKAVLNIDGPKFAELANKVIEHEVNNFNSACDTGIPKQSDTLIQPEENPVSKSSCVKIDLRSNFKKLSEKVSLFETPKRSSEAELEMYEKRLVTQTNTPEEVRIVKMVKDLDKKDKIVRIIEELDKTKSLSKRRKSSENPGPDKRAPPSKVDAAPITNALQGLQALLKMSKISDTSGGCSKGTDSVSFDKSERSRNMSMASSKSGQDDPSETQPTSRRSSDSYDHVARKSEGKTRHDDKKELKSRHRDPPATLTRINRSALVRDRQVETHTKSLVEDHDNRQNVVEDLQSVSGHNHDCYEPGRSKNKFQSFQMKDIRKRLLPGPRSTNTISSRASEVVKRKGKDEEEEVKVLSYRMVKPKIENDDNYERVIRKVEDPNLLHQMDKNKLESVRISEGVARKVTEVSKVIDTGDNRCLKADKIEENAAQRSLINSEASINLFQKSIVKIQAQENTENPSNLAEGRKSLDLIKEELERVTSKVNNIKKNSSSKEISSDDDMKVIMKDVEDMEQDLNEITAEPEDGRRSRSKKKKHKDDRKKKKKSKHVGDIAIDSRIAKKIISRIISSDMGKSFNEAIKQEVGETESAIEKIREDLRKKSCQESRSKKKNKRDKSKDGRDKKKKKRDRHEDEENPRDLCLEKKKKKRSRERSSSHSEEVWVDKDHKSDVRTTLMIEKREAEKISYSKNSKKRKSRSPVRYYDQVPSFINQEENEHSVLVDEKRKSKTLKHDEEREFIHKKKKSKKKHKRNKEKEESNTCNTEVLQIVDKETGEVTESNSVSQQRIVRKGYCSPSKDFDLVLGVTEDDLLDESISLHENKTASDVPDSITEPEVDTTVDSNIEENFCNSNNTDISTRVIDAALEDIPTPEASTEANTSVANSGATSSANSEDEQSEDEDNLRALLLSQLSKTRCGPKSKSKRKAAVSKITKISWSSPPPETVEVSSTTPSVPPTSSYPTMGSLPVYAYAYSRTFITPAEKLLYFPNLYNRVLVPLDLESDSDSDCHPDCDSFWGEKRTSQWVSDRVTHTQGFSDADPRFSQANLNLVMRGRESCSPAPN